MTPRPISADAARRFFVTRHLLVPPRSLAPGPVGVLQAFERLGSVQFDPLGVAGRNHDLVLHARVAGYRTAWTEHLLYTTRDLFEAYNKGLSLLPTSELPWFRHTWDRHARMYKDGVFVRHAATVKNLLDRIRAEGPMSSLDFERLPPVAWAWGPTSEVRAVLEALSEAGVLALARRDGNRRYYDLVERVFPAELLAHRPSEREQVRHRLLSRYRAHGLLGATGQAEIFLGVTPSVADPARAHLPTRGELREELVATGELVPVEVDGVRGVRHVLRDEITLLDEAERQTALPGPPRATFLAPLDPFVWDRDFVRALFGFDYIWEVYVPEAKRRWGYYVLPLLFGDRLVGRIEPRIDRSSATVRVLGTWWEPGFDPRTADGFVDAMREALAAYLAFGGATRIEWAAHLGRQRRLFGTGGRRASSRRVSSAQGGEPGV